MQSTSCQDDTEVKDVMGPMVAVEAEGLIQAGVEEAEVEGAEVEGAEVEEAEVEKLYKFFSRSSSALVPAAAAKLTFPATKL